MRVLVTGVNGQLGHDVVHYLRQNNIEPIETDVKVMDLTNEAQVRSFITQSQPDAIIHCAAYTAVDKAEDDSELCHKVNVLGTQYIAQVAQDYDLKMIYISTDYVFSGEGELPFGEFDELNPQNVYGRTKALGEDIVQNLVKRHFIVRISWAFGLNGNNFVKTMIKLGREKDSLNVVNDQIGSPTYTKDVAKLLVKMIVTDKYGIYHATNLGYCSWYEFALEIFRLTNIDVKVNPVDSSTFITKAIRPKNSRLSRSQLSKNGFDLLPSWQDALSRYIIELKSNEAI